MPNNSRLSNWVYVLWLVSLILGCVFVASAQRVSLDSLQNAVKTATEDTAKVNKLNFIGKALWRKGNYKRAAEYAQQAKNLAEKLKFQAGASNAYSLLGLANTEEAKYADALKNYKQALDIRMALGDKKAVAASYNNIGVVHIFEERLEDALTNHLQALKIAKEAGDKVSMVTAYSNMGIVYAQQGNYEEALKCNFEAVRLKQEIAQAGKVEPENYNIQTAFHGPFKKGKSPFTYLQTASETNETAVELYLNIARILTQQKKYAEAKTYLDKALKEAKESKALRQVLESYKALAALAAIGGNFQNAYEYYKKYGDLKDSMRESEDSASIAMITDNCESEKMQIRQELQCKLDKANTTVKWLIIGSLTTILILLLLFISMNYRLYLQKKQAQQDLFMKNRQE